MDNAQEAHADESTGHKQTIDAPIHELINSFTSIRHRRRARVGLAGIVSLAEERNASPELKKEAPSRGMRLDLGPRAATAPRSVVPWSPARRRPIVGVRDAYGRAQTCLERPGASSSHEGNGPCAPPRVLPTKHARYPHVGGGGPPIATTWRRQHGPIERSHFDALQRREKVAQSSFAHGNQRVMRRVMRTCGALSFCNSLAAQCRVPRCADASANGSANNGLGRHGPPKTRRAHTRRGYVHRRSDLDGCARAAHDRHSSDM